MSRWCILLSRRAYYMILLYTSPGCSSCRKVKQWLKDREIPFVEKNLFTTLLNHDEVKFMLKRTENGSDDIISKRSKVMNENNINVEDMTTNELVDFIIANPSVLKRPIIISETNFQVGYDEEEIDAFVPAELRNIATATCNKTCPNYKGCGKVRE